MDNFFKKAERKQLKLRLAIEGPSGSGKTYSALRIANGLVSDGAKIAVIDTENDSASLYSSDFEFDVAALPPPYTPEAFVKYLNMAVNLGYECVIIDTISHEWRGTGGVLDIHQASGDKNSYTAWGKITPRHDKFLDAILHCPVHVIVTMRSKQGYVLEVNQYGKQVPKKIGMQPIQRDGIEYEFTAVLSLGANNEAQGTKDRTQMFPADKFFLPTEETGKKLAEWLKEGKRGSLATVAEYIKRMNSADSLESLGEIFTELNKTKRDYSNTELSRLVTVKDIVKEKLSKTEDVKPKVVDMSEPGEKEHPKPEAPQPQKAAAKDEDADHFDDVDAKLTGKKTKKPVKVPF